MWSASRIIKQFALFYQLLLCCVSIGLCVACLVQMLSVQGDSSLKPKAVLLASFLISGAVGAFAAAGVYSAVHDPYRKTKRCMSGVFYLIGVAVAVALIAVGGVRVESFLNDEAWIESELSQLWDHMDDVSASRVQAWGQCCGFQNYADRVMEPCVEYSPSVGCKEVMEAVYLPTMGRVLGPAIFLFIAACVGLFVEVVLLVVLVVEKPAAYNAGGSLNLHQERKNAAFVEKQRKMSSGHVQAIGSGASPMSEAAMESAAAAMVHLQATSGNRSSSAHSISNSALIGASQGSINGSSSTAAASGGSNGSRQPFDAWHKAVFQPK